jgi:hypothetical protein
MDAFEQFAMRSRARIAMVLALACTGFFLPAFGQELKVTLSGAEEIPPVQTSASAAGRIRVAPDRTVTGSVTVSGMTVTVAHIHEGRAGSIGPIIVPLTKTSDNVWSVPPDTKLTEAQFESYKAGNLYFNVHSAAFRTGEVRGQIRP